MANWKDNVGAPTTGNLSPFPPASLRTIDGVALKVGDRVLVKDLLNASKNGIWVAAASGAWTRAPDANTSALMTPEMAVRVSEGTSNAHTEWFLSTQNPTTLETTGLFYTQTNILNLWFGQISFKGGRHPTGIFFRSLTTYKMDRATIQIFS
jgi:phage-related tail fiber protein